ncbi:hypothetical protein PIB30_027922 [Stylosanthes scabra]|uniref:DUF4283 domain-containing protein n=1 Tax=Stylosanthes scabra TaxID=79078 RepID=A0ABU6QB61_9FABA|nr:hypothetical protein [Stylosanthes scabra]
MDESKLFVTLSKYGRSSDTTTSERKQTTTTLTWVPKVERNDQRGTKIKNDSSELSDDNKVVQVIWAEDEKERLERSLLGVCVEPIEFREVMYHLLDEWKGPGKIECRDVGPYRCLLTFDSPENRDEAFNSELLQSTFDEIVPHWNIFGSLSRRVWIEIMGMPTCLWCKENFKIQYDDRTELSKSYSVARVLLDCYQREQISEWVKLSIDDRSFTVFGKEVGPEAYSMSAHPNLEDSRTQFLSSGDDATSSAVSETSLDHERTGEGMVGTARGLGKERDPQLDAIIDGSSRSVLHTNPGWGYEELEKRGYCVELRSRVHQTGIGSMTGVFVGFDLLDPMYINAHKGAQGEAEGFHLIEPNWERESNTVVANFIHSNGEEESLSFNTEGEREDSDETLYLINKEKCLGTLDEQVVCEGSGECNPENGDRPSDVRTTVPTNGVNDGTDRGRAASVVGPHSLLAETEAVGGDGEWEDAISESGSDDTLYRINDNFVGEIGDVEEDLKSSEDYSGRDSIEEENSTEVYAAKEVWGRGGLAFDSSKEEELRSKLFRQRKLDGKRRTDLRPKEQRQTKKAPCIQERTLATRKLMSGTKPKLK